LIKGRKLPLSLLRDNCNSASARLRILDIEKFEVRFIFLALKDTFGGKSRRKRPRLSATTLEELTEKATESTDKYDVDKDLDL
jgi:nuclear GTP-binding protein